MTKMMSGRTIELDGQALKGEIIGHIDFGSHATHQI